MEIEERERPPDEREKRGVVRMETRLNSKEKDVKVTVSDDMRRNSALFDSILSTGLITDAFVSSLLVLYIPAIPMLTS